MKKFFVVVLIFMLLIAGIYLLAGLQPIQRFALEYAKKTVSARLEVELTVEDIRGNLFHHLTLNEVKAGDILEVETIEIRYNPLWLVRKRISISRICLGQPVINIEEALKVKIKKNEGRPIDFNIGMFILDSGKIVYKENKIDFSTQLSFMNNYLEVTHLTLSLPHSKCVTSGCYKVGRDMHFFNKLNIDLSDIGIKKGNITSRGEIGGSLENPGARGNFELTSIEFGKIALSYLYKDKTAYLNDILISGKRFQLSGNAKYNLSSKDGEIFLSGDVAGEKLNINGVYNNNRINIVLKNRRSKLSLLGSMGKEIDISISGNYNKRPISGRLMYKNRIISGNLFAAPLTFADMSINRLSIKFDYKMTGEKRKGEGEVVIKGIKYSNNELGTLTLRSKMENDSICVGLTGFIKGKGNISLQKPFPFLIFFSMEKLRLDNFVKEGSGFITLEGDIKGNLAAPEKSSGLVKIKDFLYEMKGLQVAPEAGLALKFSNRRLTVEPVKLEIGGQEIEICGILPLFIKGGLDFNIKTERFNLDVLNPLLNKKKIFGLVSSDIKVKGDVEKPQLFGGSKIERLFFVSESDTLGPIDCCLNFDQHLMEIDPLTIHFNDYVITNRDPVLLQVAERIIEISPSQLQIGEDTLYFSGLIPINHREKMDFNILTRGLNLNVFNPAIPQNIISGQLDLDMRFYGELSEPQFYGGLSIDGLNLIADEDSIGPVNLDLSLDGNNIFVDTLSVLVRNSTVTNDGRITVIIDREFISIQPSRVKLDKKAVTFEGQLPLTQEKSIEFKLNSDSLDLSLLSPMLPGIELYGFLSLTVDVKGNLNKPEFFGNANIISLLVITERDTIGPINGNFEFNKGIVGVNKMSINYRSGKVVLNGNVGIDKDALLDISFQKIRIPVMKRSFVGLDGNLHLIGNISSSELKGEILMTSSYLEPIELQLIQRILNRVNRPPKKLPEFLNKITLNFGVDTDIEIHNRVADINVDGDLNILGTAAKQGVTGRIRIIEEGRIGYLDRDFTIEKGSIDFVNPNDISPDLDINALREISYMGTDYNILLSITGSPEDINIDLNSQPELPKQEVFALVFTGQTRGVTQMTSSQGVGEKAVDYLVESMKGKVEERIARTLGLVKVSVSGSITDPSLLKMGVEKRFIKRLKVSYTSNFDNWREPLVGFNYEINRNISLYSMYNLENQDSVAGLDFQIKLW